MSLFASLNIASSGLTAVQYELSVASQNVANASTPGYVTEIANVAARASGSQGSGVVIKLTSRAVNDVLQNELYAQNATVAGLGVTTNALDAVSSVQGSTSADAGSSNTLSDNLGALSNSYSTLESDPSNTVEQQTVVDNASTLAGSIQTLSNTYQTERQNAHESIRSEIDTVNTSLAAIGSISQDIVELKGSGQDTADLENQRAAEMSNLSQYLSVKYTETATGDMLVSTADGLTLPTSATSGPLSMTDTTVNAGAAYPGTIPGVELNGEDVTTDLSGGSIGANLTLRDTTLPTMQGELDSFAGTLSSRFAAQGLTLFTDASGNTAGTSPTQTAPAGQLGFSATIEVNPAVTANPALVRDGNQAIQDPTQGAATVPGAVLSGASAFTPNPSGGPVGFSTLINRVLNYSLGTTIDGTSAQSTAAVSGLGANGTLSAPYTGGGDLGTLATTLTSSQAETISNASNHQTTQTDIQTNLQTKLTSTSSVSVDDQMSNVVALQNAYEANAKVVAAVQTMFSALLSAIS